MTILGSSPESQFQAAVDHSLLLGFSKNHVAVSLPVNSTGPTESTLLGIFLKFQAEFDGFRYCSLLMGLASN